MTRIKRDGRKGKGKEKEERKKEGRRRVECKREGGGWRGKEILQNNEKG